MDDETNRLDRLYKLLPAVYRLRDADEGLPLQAFLRVIAEQVNALEDDILQLYDNWFIETAQDWVVPYIGDLIGYRPGRTTGDGDGGAAVPEILVPRREVAKTIGYRRRKGAPALLEDLARNVAGWPGYAVEFRRLLAWFQNVNHLRPGVGGTVDLHQVEPLQRLDTPADELTHLADVRTIGGHRDGGYYNLPAIGLFVWRLKSYPVARVLAQALDGVQDAYTFSILGNDLQLFTAPPADGPTDGCPAVRGPTPISREAFQRHPECYYGVGKSFAIWTEGDDGTNLVPPDAIVPADLSDWQYRPRRGKVAVDPVRGRISFALGTTLRYVRVSYYYGFSMDMGGGQYERPLIQPQTYGFERVTEALPRPAADLRAGRRDRSGRSAKVAGVPAAKPASGEEPRKITQVIEAWRTERDNWRDEDPSPTDPDAYAAWLQREPPRNLIVELSDNGIYSEPFDIQLEPYESVQIRAANGMRPTLSLLNRDPTLPDALEVALAPASHFTLDGLLITGRPVHVTSHANGFDDALLASCPPSVTIRHCTLVPGWGLDENCEPQNPAEPSLELTLEIPARVSIQHSIVGSIQVYLDPVATDPMSMEVTDSILDATSDEAEALGSPGYPEAHVLLTIRRATVFGSVNVHAIEMAENAIFTNCLNVARRQLGCMRFCYVPHGCRTPRRYNCQPDLAAQAAADELARDDAAAQKAEPTQDEILLARSRAYERSRPQFSSKRYGTAEYARLADTCPQEISQGADDESEMGAFHDLFQPQRTANLAAALEAYTPAEMEAGIIFAS